MLQEARPDYVIHLAALSYVARNDSTGFYAVNTVGTTNLLEAIVTAKLNLRRVVIASSANVYGNATVEPITEATPPAPVNHYAASKLAMEVMVRTYADRFPIVLTRPFNYTGVGQTETFWYRSWWLILRSAGPMWNWATSTLCAIFPTYDRWLTRTCACSRRTCRTG